MTKVICTICARGGSKGVKNKNVRHVLGKPLIAFSIEQAIQSKLFDQVVVSTDSEEISSIAKEFGAQIFFKRPLELSGDSSPKLPVIQHAFLSSEEYLRTQFDYCVDLDATSPLRSIEDITNSLSMCVKEPYNNIITAMPSRRSPYFNMIELNDEGKISLSKTSHDITRRQDAPKCYDMNASIYVWTRDSLLNESKIINDHTGLYIMPEERSIDIDSELDFEFVEWMITKNSKV